MMKDGVLTWGLILDVFCMNPKNHPHHEGAVTSMNRHERRAAAAKTRQVVVPAAALPRVMGFLNAFHAAPNDADIDIRIGASSEGEAGIMITISGGGDHVLTCREGRKIADVMEDAMRAHPDDPESHTLPNIIMGLREACDRAEQSAS